MKQPCILLKIPGYKLLQIVNISCHYIGLYSPCSSGVNEPFNGKGKLNNYTDMWHSFFQAVSAVAGPAAAWSWRRREQLNVFLPALGICQAGSQLSAEEAPGQCPVSLSCCSSAELAQQEQIPCSWAARMSSAWAGPSIPWDNPLTSYGLALPYDCWWWQHQAGQRREAHGQHESTRCPLTISVLIVNTTFSISRTPISWQIVSGAMLTQMRFFFLLIPFGV